MRALLPALPMLLLAACGAGGDGVTATTNMVAAATPVAASDAGQGARYACADGRAVRAVFADPDTLTLHIGDTPIAMRSTTAKNGARYVGDGWQWWTHGLQQATLAPLAAGEDVASARGTTCRTT